ncbi:MAG: hypothetical protein JF595_16550 [Sphingomonadales bacterium]|nr:hypothetical protein [Sphingomonadales bacterium]
MNDGIRESDVMIGNVSTRGLMAKCDRPPAKGARVEIRQGELSIAGQVIWSKNRRFGLRSEEAIDVAALFPPRAQLPARAVRRFAPADIGPAPQPHPQSRAKPRKATPKRKQVPAGNGPRDPIVTALVATAATLVVELNLDGFSAVWDALRLSIPG